MIVGLLTVKEEHDILGWTLERMAPHVEAFYVLDGSREWERTLDVCRQHPQMHGFTRDDDLPASYEAGRDGIRQHLLEQATADYGADHWFLLMHADEVWTVPPRSVADNHPDADGIVVPVACYFPREPWDDSRGPEQLTWHLAPGWPELRMFRGDVAYDPHQHFDVTPRGVSRLGYDYARVNHYPFRSPQQNRARAAATWDPDNYRAVPDVWDDRQIERFRAGRRCWEVLACD